VVGEAARFSFDPSASLQMMAFDLQTGLAFGRRSRREPAWASYSWSEPTAVDVDDDRRDDDVERNRSLGVRASVEVGPVDLWIGADAMARTSTLETGGSDPVQVPTFTALLSAGCFLPRSRRARCRGDAAARGARAQLRFVRERLGSFASAFGGQPTTRTALRSPRIRDRWVGCDRVRVSKCSRSCCRSAPLRLS